MLANWSKSLRLASCMRRAASVSLLAAAMCLSVSKVKASSEVLSRVGEAEEGFQRRLIATVDAACAPFLVHDELGLSARRMEVQIRVEIFVIIEALDGLGILRANMAVADMLSNHRAILSFH